MLLLAAMATCSASADIIVPVSQDGWIDHNDGIVQGAGVGTRLNVATPNPAAAQQYSRVAYFGFDVSAIDLTQVASATLNLTGAPNIGGYNGANDYRIYLVNNLINDSFDETTLTDGNAPGHSNQNRLTGQRTNGTILGDVAVGNPASMQIIALSFSASSLADLMNDSNNFLTMVAEYRGQNNTGYGPQTGLGFNSKEAGSGAATIDFTMAIPEPSSIGLFGIGAISLLLYRRRH